MIVIGILVVLALVVAIWLLGGAALIGVAGAMFFDQPWRAGWDSAWDNLGYLILFGLIAGIVYGGSSRTVG